MVLYCSKTRCHMISTEKPVLSNHSKIDKTKALKKFGSFMKVKSIAEFSLVALLEHSAILLICIKGLSVLKTNFGLLF